MVDNVTKFLSGLFGNCLTIVSGLDVLDFFVFSSSRNKVFVDLKPLIKVYIYYDNKLLGPVVYFFDPVLLVYGPFRQINMHSVHLCLVHVISTGRQMTNLMLNVCFDF